VIDIAPATPERWPDVVDLFERPGPRGGTPIPSGCWCQYWHLRGKAYSDGWGGGNRRRLEEQVRSGAEPGLLASMGGEPMGWCRLGPRDSFERLQASKLRPPDEDDDDAWAVVCFYVHPAAKRKGIATALLAAAREQAAARGAPVLEGYAVRPGHANIDAYTGYRPMFEAAGFVPVREAGRRTVMRLRLSPP
jgi:GNAT superfamily N-acetyltransferase